MRIGDFDFYRDYFKAKTGLALTADKSYMLVSRLTPISKKWDFPTLEAMTMAMRGMPDPKMTREILDAMMMGDTGFFRDPDTFRHLAETIVPDLLKNRKKKSRLRVWSAGCSTGQEAWSIAIALREMAPAPATDILATDICDLFMKQAVQAEYTQFELQRGLSMPILTKYFEPLPGGNWKAQPVLQNMVHFQLFNLMQPMNKIGRFDIVFCRHVLNGFDKAARDHVLKGLSGCLVPDGILVMGADETIEASESFHPFPSLPGFFVPRAVS